MSIYTAIQNLTPNGEVLSVFNPQVFNIAKSTSITVAQAQISGDLNVGGTSTIEGETLLNALEVRTTTQLHELEVYNNAKFFGDVEVPTVSQNSNNDKIASTKYCDTAISNLVNGSPQLLDTLSELSLALNNDNNFASNITNLISTKAGLSQSNNFTGTNNFTAPLTFTSTLNNIDPNTFSLIGNLTDDAQEQFNNLSDNLTNLNEIKANLVYVEQADQLLQSNISSTQTNLQGQIDSLNNSKANLAYVEQVDQGLQVNLNNAQSNLQGQIDNLNTVKANLQYVQDSNELLQNQINTKASSIYVDGIKTILESSISTLETQTNNALNTKASLNYVDQNNSVLNISLGALETNLQTQIDTVKLEKADITYVDGIETNILSSISSLESNVNSQLTSLSNTKADITYVDNAVSTLINSAPETLNTLGELASAFTQSNDIVTALTTQIGTKASTTYVDNADTVLQTQITNLSSTKANQLYVEQADQTLQSNISSVQSNLQGQIDSLSTSKANLAYVEQVDQGLQTSINNLDTSIQNTLLQKASITELNTLGSTINSSITDLQTTKLDTSVFNSEVSNLQSDLNTKASLNYVDTQLFTKASKTELSGQVSILQNALNILNVNKADVTYVNTVISELVSSAPETLNTLSELSSALGSDPNFATTISTEIGTKASTSYVDTINTNLQGQIDSKPNIQYVNDQLDLKANIAYVDNVDLQLQTQIDTKSSLSYVNSQLDTKASIGYVDSATTNLQSQINNLGTTKASISYVDTSISNLVSSAPETLNTLNELALALGSDANFATTITTSLASKADKTYVDSTDANLQSQITSLDTLKASIAYVDTAISSVSGGSTVDISGKADITYVDTADTNLQNQITTLDINKASKTYVDSADVNLQSQINNLGTTKATYTYVDTSIANLVGSAPSTLNTLQELSQALGSDPNFATTITNSIANKANDTDVVKLTGAQTISGVKTFSNNIIVPSLNGITSTTLGFLDATSSIQTQLNGKASSSNAVTLSGAETITGTKTFNNLNYNARIGERMTTNAATTSTYTLDFNSSNCIYNISAPPSTNFTIAVTNLPLTIDAIYTFTLTINTITNKVYANAININGTSRTSALKYNGGLSSVNVTGSHAVFQTFSIFVVDGGVIPLVATSVSSLS